MQQIQINDDIASLLNELAEYQHISASDLIAQLVKSYQTEITKQNELKVFFKPYQKDISTFQFDREAANER